MECITCDIPLQKTTVTFRGLVFEAWRCPKCKEKIFTEAQSLTVVRQLDQQRLAQEYIKTPMRIGRSWGMTFPKEMATMFNLNDKKTKMHLIPHVADRKIIIQLEE